MPTVLRLRTIAPLLALVLLAACGSNNSPAAVVTATPQASEPPGTVPVGGDIPDNVVYLMYSGSGFSIKYPEGWVRNPTAVGVTFNDKDSFIKVAINSGTAPTTQSVTDEINAMAGARITAPANQVSLPAGTAIKITYEIAGAADPVTGKQPKLTVDRYEISSSGKVAVLDLAAQVGIDNADAYLLMAKSFKWTA